MLRPDRRHEDAVYDHIGRTYARTRRTDLRLAGQLWQALGPGDSLLNVGAGTGNYEPGDRDVVAVEPSLEMIRQRPRSHHVVRGVAEALPFRDDQFDAAMAILTVHHWRDPAAGLLELRRVARRQVVWYTTPLDPSFWLLRYFGALSGSAAGPGPPPDALLRRCFGVVEVRPLLIPYDCVDGFGVAFWARPEAYLDPMVQEGMSCLALLSPAERQAGTRRLAADLASGEWDRRYGHLRGESQFDGGFRIAIAGDVPGLPS
jgi:SAM-dependent methyltransferase